MSEGPLIAIVDDDESAREAVASLVRALGFGTRQYRSAADYLASGDRQRTSCLVADMRMPAMTGLELYRSLAASGTPPTTILVTAWPDEATRQEALGAGVACYLGKPIHPDGLLACIRTAFGRGAEPEQTPEP
jgi:FixJ family two-component response regulator